MTRSGWRTGKGRWGFGLRKGAFAALLWLGWSAAAPAGWTASNDCLQGSGSLTANRSATSATLCEGFVRLHAPSVALLSRHTIPVCRTGTLALDPADACTLLARTNLLELVQQQYARQLPAGQLPEFTVQHAASNTYAYVNRHGQHSTITEVGRLRLDNDGFAIVFYTFGERDFGKFESLSYVTVTPATTAGRCRYDVAVHAYPHGYVRRFIARHLGLIERYFRNKTSEMEALLTDLCLALCEREAGRAADGSPRPSRPL